jgi:D-sorbitol dehydrogenase (acceptor)
MSRLPSKIALVTGAARGIGLACAKAFASEGALLIATDIELAVVTGAARGIGLSAIGRELNARGR